MNVQAMTDRQLADAFNRAISTDKALATLLSHAIINRMVGQVEQEMREEMGRRRGKGCP